MNGKIVETAQIATGLIDTFGSSAGAGALFGLAFTPYSDVVYYVDDIANSLPLLANHARTRLGARPCPPGARRTRQYLPAPAGPGAHSSCRWSPGAWLSAPAGFSWSAEGQARARRMMRT